MRSGHYLKCAVFPRKMTSFLTLKWLFCEGNTKMCVLEVWEVIFDTLGQGLKTEGRLSVLERWLLGCLSVGSSSRRRASSSSHGVPSPYDVS